MTAERPARGGRARRHLLVAGFVVAYLTAGGMTLALGDRVTSGGWLAVHLVLFGAVTNAIVV
jgi:nitrite reductase (NO-forming)